MADGLTDDRVAVSLVGGRAILLSLRKLVISLITRGSSIGASQLAVMTEEQGQNYSPLAFIWGHLFASFSAPNVDLTGRTALVTGGNGGYVYVNRLLQGSTAKEANKVD